MLNEFWACVFQITGWGDRKKIIAKSHPRGTYPVEVVFARPYPFAPHVKVAFCPVKPEAHDTVHVAPTAVLAHWAVVAPAMKGAAHVTAVGGRGLSIWLTLNL